MGKTIVYIVLLGLLGFGVYYFLFRSNDSLYSEAEANFTIRDTANISRIYLVQTNGEAVLLERGANNWTVNKKYVAMRRPLLNLLVCLNRQTALYPVSAKEHDRVIKYLAGNAVKVEVYDLKGEKIRTFYVAGQGPDFHGSYMMIEGSSNPYLVEVPGFQGYLTPRFTTDIEDWRSRTIFDHTADKIKSVRIDYDGNPLNSFVLENKKEGQEVILDPQLMSSKNVLNRLRVVDYLNSFQNINCEGYLNGTLKLDSTIMKSKKYCTITLAGTDGKTEQVDCYLMDINKRSKNMASYDVGNTSSPYDIDRMYAVLHDSKDTALIQARTFSKIFRSGYEFYQATDTTKTKPQEKVTVPMLR